MKTLRWIVKFLPTLLTALILAIIVWVSAVSSADPNEEREYSAPIPITVQVWTRTWSSPDSTTTK